MPLFAITNNKLTSVDQLNFSSEKELQHLIERNLTEVFGCRLVASEYSTGAVHAGRIDTLALSEDNNPVIIEYKKVESSELITQGLFYLAWLQDHHGDFELAAQRSLGQNVEVDWSDIRVICLAPNYRKYDLHAAQVTGANLELWTYRLFRNSSLYLEEVLQKTASSSSSGTSSTLTSGQKAALTRQTGQYTFDEHLVGKSNEIVDLAHSIQEFVLGLDPSIEEAPKKLYVAYKIAKNIVCMEIQRQRIVLFLKLNPTGLEIKKGFVRDVSNIGHSGTGDIEVTIKSEEQFEEAKPLIRLAYQKVGG